MRILHVYRDALRQGGVPHQTRQLVAAQIAGGHSVAVLAERPDIREEVALHDRAGFTPAPLTLTQLPRFIQSWSPDICHISGLGIPAQALPLEFIRFAGIPYVVSPDGLLAPAGLATRFESRSQTLLRKSAKRLYRSLIDLRALKHAEVIHCQSLYEAERVRLMLPDVATEVISLGVDREWLDADEPKTIRNGRDFTFGYLGRLDPFHKGLDIVAAALRDLPARTRPSVIFAGVPVAGFDRFMRDSAMSLNIEVRGRTYGAEKRLFWGEIDAFLGVFRYAGQARAIAEALGNALPVIASREGNWGDWIRSAGAGLSVSLDKESVAEAILAMLLMPPAAYRSMSANALSLARSWTWDRVAAAMEDMYKKAIASYQDRRS